MEKGNCWSCGTEIDVQMCCSGSVESGCGCMGMPIDPPFCSEKCYKIWMKKREIKLKKEKEKMDIKLNPIKKYIKKIKESEL